MDQTEDSRRSRRLNRDAATIPVRAAPDRKAAKRTAEAPAQVQGVKETDAKLDLSETQDRGRDEDRHEITRKTRGERNVDRFAVPESWKKRGWVYQFWVHTVYNQPVEGTTEIYEGGWRPVYWKDVPKPWAPGAKADEQIERGGQQLYLRPKNLNDAAIREDYEAAEQQRTDRMRSATQGRIAGGEGLADIKGIRPHALALEVEGEVGVQSKRTPTE